jgi:SAM-dependent methyltransferase
VTETPDHVIRNRVAWDRMAADYAGPGLVDWAAAEPAWGIWGVPEEQLGILPPDLDGADSIELGCGTGYVSAWLARRGTRPVGLDNSAAQLSTARALQERFGLRFPLLHANAEQVPCADASFDLAISEYGASIWCDRPGGDLRASYAAPRWWRASATSIEGITLSDGGYPGRTRTEPFCTLAHARPWVRCSAQIGHSVVPGEQVRILKPTGLGVGSCTAGPGWSEVV